MRAGIYTRLSSDPRGRGKSVAEQEQDARADVARNGWELAEVYCDNNRSASKYATRDREAFRRMVADIEARKLDVVVAWEASRFTRDTAVYTQLADACVRNDVRYSYNGRVLDLSDPDDAFSAGLDALLSEREAGIVRKRVNRTHRLNAKAGLPHGLIPYGYRRVYDIRSGALVEQVPDEAEAVIVREIFHRVAAGEALRGIARSLSARGVVTPSGADQWTPVSVRRIAERRGYLGKRTWKGQVMEEGGWEPLVTPETFDRCQEILADPRRRAVRSDSRVRHLLTGILQCDECDTRVAAAMRNGVLCYVCPLGHVARKKTMIDDPLCRLIVRMLADPRMAVGASPVGGALLEEADQIDRDLAQLEADVEAGEISARMATAEERRLQTRQEEIAEALRRQSPLPEVVRNAAGPAAEANWIGMGVEGQRAVVRALFSSLRVVKKKGQTQIGRHAPGVLFVLSRDPAQEPVLLTG